MRYLKFVGSALALTCALFVAPLFAEAAPEKQAKKSETLVEETVKSGGPQSHTVVLKPEPAQPAWVKVCGQDEANGKEVCFTTREFVIPENDQPIMAMAIYDVKGMPEKMIRFRLPLSLRLQPGIRVNMDKSTSIDGKYAVCFPNGCYVEIPVKEEFVTAIKNGKTLRLRAQNQIGEEVIFESPVDGFGKSYDGKAIDPKELAEQQKKLQEALIERSEVMRKKLEAQEKERAEKAGKQEESSTESKK